MESLNLKGAKAPPLVNGKFCFDTYHKWVEVNKLKPTDMTFEEWKAYCSRGVAPTEYYARIEWELTKLSNIKYWWVANGIVK